MQTSLRRVIRVAVIVNHIEGYARGILRGVLPFAFARGWECNVVGVPAPESPYLASDMDGMIVQVGLQTDLARLLWANVPIVNVSSSIRVDAVPSVVCDDRAVGRLGAEHFLRMGFRRLIWYSPLHFEFAKLRQQGFLNRLSEEEISGIPVFDRVGLATLLHQIEKPAAVMCCNDVSALAVLQQCRSDQIKVPDQIAVLGVDNDDLIQSLAWPPLSSIGTATEQIGFEAAVLLERMMKTPRRENAMVMIPPTGVITRRSTDIALVVDPEVAEALRFIRNYATGPVGVEQVVSSVAVSRRQLERRFRAQLGRSMLDEIRRCRVERARQLLLETDLTIPQIATASGFSSASYLTVVFGKLAGQSPGSFRRKAAANLPFNH